MSEMVNDAQKQELISWLNNALGMEMGLIQVLEHHARDARTLPRLQERLQAHVQETHQQAERVERAIALAGGKPSSGKSWLGDILGRVNALSTGMYSDELVKNALMDYAAEQFEIACYKSLIVAAEELGLADVASLCRQNLQEEQAMAHWLDSFIPEVTAVHLRHQATRAAA